MPEYLRIITEKFLDSSEEIKKYFAEMEMKSQSWDFLKTWVQIQEYESRGKDYGTTSYIYTNVIRKMNELEQETQSNEKSEI